MSVPSATLPPQGRIDARPGPASGAGPMSGRGGAPAAPGRPSAAPRSSGGGVAPTASGSPFRDPRRDKERLVTLLERGRSTAGFGADQSTPSAPTVGIAAASSARARSSRAMAGLNVHDVDSLRRAIVVAEILNPPMGLREEYGLQ
jgi:hypothetical protein